MTNLSAPFPWFGGKRRVADLVWQRFGRVQNYVEPFFGSGAVLLGRPDPIAGNETINDADGYVANFWRAVTQQPEEVAGFADWPVNENDLHARHAYLVGQRDDLTRRLEGEADYFDAKVAGWWVWGISCWIGSGFCSGAGPWRVVNLGDNGQGVNRQLVHLGNNGQGVNRQLVHLGNNGQGVNRQLVHLGDNGRGVNRKRVHLSGNGGGIGVTAHGVELVEWFSALAERLRRVRVCCGDWTRVMGPSVTTKHGLTAVFLDPPYGETRAPDLYRVDSQQIAKDVHAWALQNGTDPSLRIALCGYEGEYEMPSSWSVVAWNAGEGFGAQASERTGNGKRERVWFSPGCIDPAQRSLFDGARIGASA